MVHVIDSLPELYPKLEAWMENEFMEEGNTTIITLFACLTTVLHRWLSQIIATSLVYLHHSSSSCPSLYNLSFRVIGPTTLARIASHVL